MKTAIAILLGSLIISTSYIYINRYQEVGELGSIAVYKDMITRNYYVLTTEDYREEIESFKISFIPLTEN